MDDHLELKIERVGKVLAMAAIPDPHSSLRVRLARMSHYSLTTLLVGLRPERHAENFNAFCEDVSILFRCIGYHGIADEIHPTED